MGPSDNVTTTSTAALVGRDAEMTRLVDIADQAVETGTQMVVVSGEAGIGKTTTTTSFISDLESAGWSTHVGHCFEYSDRPPPYAPIVTILRSLLLDNLDHVEELTALHREDLAALLPELADPSLGPPLAGGVDRLLQAVSTAFVEATRRQPVALLVEDVHWADAASRDVLAALARSAGSGRLLVVVTVRTASVERHHPVRTWLAEHRRLDNVHSIELTGLSAEALASQAEQILGAPPDRELVAQLMDRTGGNPYYTRELVSAQRDGIDELPSSLVEFLTSRMQRLSDDERLVMRAIAIAGGSLSHPRLAAMLPATAVDAAVRDLFDRSLLVLEASQYVLGHALIREALLRDVLPFELQDLHRRAAEAIVSDPRAGSVLADAAAVAGHWESAGDADNSLATAVTAAQGAAAVAAYETAAELSLQAYRAWARAEAPEQHTELTRFQLLDQTVNWLSACWRGQEAIDLVNDALALWGPDMTSGQQALLFARQATIFWNLGEPDMPGQVLAEAQRLLGDEASAEGASVHHALASQAIADAQIEPAREQATLAMAMAMTHGPREVYVESLGIKGFAMCVAGDLDGGLTLIREGRGLATGDGLVNLVAQSYRREWLILNHFQGRVPAVLDAIDKGLGYVDRNCGPRLRIEFQLDRALHLAESGQFNRVPPVLADLHAAEVDDLRRMTILQTDAIHALGTGDLERAAEMLEHAQQVARRYDSSQETGAQLRLLAELDRREHRLDDAFTKIRRALDLQLDSDNLSYIRESIVELARIAGEFVVHRHPEAAEVLSYARRMVDRYLHPGPANQAWRSQMELELSAASGELSVTLALQAVQALTTAGYLYEAALARLTLITGRLRDPASDPQIVEDEVRDVHQLGVQHGMVTIVQAAESLAIAARIPIEGAVTLPPAEPEGAPTAELPHFLTAREVEVMSLLAEGLTNKAIGERLYVSPRTVSTHVSNLLTKLGVTNRGEAAAAYHRLALADVLDLRGGATTT